MYRSYDPDRIGQRDEAHLEALARFIDGVVRPYHRATIEGLDRIPEGAALYVGNHNGGFLSVDTFIAFSRVFLERGLEDVPYALAHSVALRIPVIVVPLGAIDASRDNAFRLLESGAKALAYPGGVREALRPFSERHRVKFSGHRGFVRVALEADVPLVPVVAAGAHSTFVVLGDAHVLARLLGLDERLRMSVWPIVWTIPWGITIGPSPPYLPLPTKIAIEFLEPIAFERSGPEAADDDAYVETCARHVEVRMQRALDRLVATKL